MNLFSKCTHGCKWCRVLSSIVMHNQKTLCLLLEGRGWPKNNYNTPGTMCDVLAHHICAKHILSAAVACFASEQFLQSGNQIKARLQASLQVNEWACKQLSGKVSRCTKAAKPASSRPQKGTQCIVQTERIVMNPKTKKGC